MATLKTAAITALTLPIFALCSHTAAPASDPSNINDTAEVVKPRYLKNSTSFSLISTDDGSIEAYGDDKVHSVGGTYSTWVEKETQEYFLYVRPVMLSEDKPDRVTFFA